MKPVPLAIRLFGALDVHVAGEPLGRVRTRSVEWLLVLLVLRPGRDVSRSWLAGTLWPESSAEQSLFNMRRNVVDLRRVLGAEADRLTSPTRDTLGLDLAGAAVDVCEFDVGVALGDEPSLKRAVSLYRGPLLSECAEAWILPERESRAEACLRALESLADGAEGRGEYAAALGYLHQAEAIDPVRDDTQRRLMQVLAADGNVAAAIQTYRQYRLRLHRELGVEPDSETTQIFQELRSSARRTTLRRPRPALAGPPPTPDPDFPPGSAGARAPLLPAASSLPRPLTALIGREEAVRQLVDVLTGARLVTLVGGGGVGKTRLALQVAEEFVGSLAEEVLFVELAPVADPSLVAASVAKVAGVREEAQADSPSVVDSLADRLSIRPALLVLDNCEHLIEIVLLLVWRLLEVCPELRVLATSRQRLGLTGEIVWRVPSLPVPEPGQMPTAAEGARAYALRYPAVQLLVERASAVRPGFQVIGRAEALAVTQICRRLDGIPLAIELAAARVEALTVGQIAARLDDRFRLLTGGSRAALPRQRTLQALIDWSYDLLPDPERGLLRRLSVFAGGWALEAAEAVCSDCRLQIADCRLSDPPVPAICNLQSAICNQDILDLLTSLVEKSLVLYEERGDAEAPGDALWEPAVGRYRMLETVREYAREKLRESGEEVSAHRRHAEFFLGVAEQARGAEAGPREEEELARLEREWDNLRAALAWSQSAAGDLELGLQLGVALGPFWKTRGYYTEGREHLARLLEPDTDRPAAITRARAWAFALAAELALLQGDSPSARPLLENSLSLARATGESSLIASVLTHPELEHDPRVRRALYEESLEIYRELGDWQHVAELLATLGMSYSGTDLVRARALYEEALALFRQLDSKSNIAWTLVHLHNLTSLQGDYAAARGYAEESLALFQALGYRMGIGCTLHQLGRVAFHEGDMDQARSLLEQGLQIARELGGQRDIAAALGALADVALAQEDPDAAAAYYEQVPRSYRETEEWTNSCLTLIGLGRLAEQVGDEARAKATLQVSLALAQKEDQPVMIMVSIEALGRVAARKGDPLGARLLAAAAAQRETIGTPVPPDERPALERALAAVQSEMGEPAFTAAWAEGSVLTLEQAAAEALA